MASRGANASPGEIIAERYRIEAWVGQGNMAVVYHATHILTGRACALKVVHAHLLERPEIQNMFVQEARVGGRIGKNPYIVDVFDAGIDAERGVPFLAMDLLEGTTLDQYLRERGPIPPNLLKTLWTQLADAMEQAHAADVVHRDLKPGNLFLTSDRKGNPQLRVVDFGIAKVLEKGVQRAPTQVGTPAYAAPEQLGQAMRLLVERVGQRVADEITPMTDVWALGIITYEMLTGARAGQLWGCGEGDSIPDLMVRVGTTPVPRASVQAGHRAHLLPHGFDAWLERCLQKNAQDRWSSVDVAVKRLVELLDAQAPPKETDDPAVAVRFGAGGTLCMSNRARKNLPGGHVDATLPSVEEPSGASIPEATVGVDQQAGTSARPPPWEETPPHGATMMPISDTLRPSRNGLAKRFGVRIIGAVLGLSIMVLAVRFYIADKPEPSPPPPRPSETPDKPRDATPPPIQVPVPIPSESVPAPLTSATPSPSATPSSSTPPPPPQPPAKYVAFLSIRTSPASTIILNGRTIGQSPKIGYPVAAGQHKFLFVYNGKMSKVYSTVIAPGERKTFAVVLD